MWKRSEVELLTGLERHVIQNLCNKNTSRDGLGFWEPAVMKPGYSRFDEGDLCMFYLVRQLIKVGFAPSEMSFAVKSLLEEGNSFVDALKKRVQTLDAQRLHIESQLAAAKRLEQAVVCRPEERLYAVMACEVLAGVGRAVDAAARELRVASRPGKRTQARLCGLAKELLGVVWGNCPSERARALSDRLKDLQARGVDPAGAEARDALFRALRAQDDSGFVSAEDSGPDQHDVLLASSLAAFLKERENGVPIELSLGKGSFQYLGQAAAAYVLWLEQRVNSNEHV